LWDNKSEICRFGLEIRCYAYDTWSAAWWMILLCLIIVNKDVATISLYYCVVAAFVMEELANMKLG